MGAELSMASLVWAAMKLRPHRRILKGAITGDRLGSEIAASLNARLRDWELSFEQKEP